MISKVSREEYMPCSMKHLLRIDMMKGVCCKLYVLCMVNDSCTAFQSPDHMSTVMAKLWFDHNVESSLSSLKKEEHEKRTRDLRKQLEYIADTNWKYSPVEKYIGQQ